jgi:hypothetical protein
MPRRHFISCIWSGTRIERKRQRKGKERQKPALGKSIIPLFLYRPQWVWEILEVFLKEAFETRRGAGLVLVYGQSPQYILKIPDSLCGMTWTSHHPSRGSFPPPPFRKRGSPKHPK